MRVKDIKIGETYNGVKVLEKFRENRQTKYWCVCPKCGKKIKVTLHQMGLLSSCRACKDKSMFNNLAGRAFGCLEVLEYMGKRGHNHRWLCRCECGKIVERSTPGLLKPGNHSCGCKQDYSKTAKRMHDTMHERRKSASSSFMSNKRLESHPLWTIWMNMIARCTKPQNDKYHLYGGRGIKVCDRWKRENFGFENFVNDMGERPSPKHSIDRIDVNGDYCPENCRWATPREQANNRRTNQFAYLQGKRMSIAEFCREYNAHATNIRLRLTEGYDIDDILNNVILRRNHLNTKKLIVKPTQNRNISIDISPLKR